MNKKIRKLLKSIFYIVLGIGITLALHQPVDVMAADLEFQNNAISNISNNDARISAQIVNSSKMNVTETGFYLGTSSGALSKCSNKDSGSWKYSKISVGFTMSQYWGTLSENTTYYYCFYAIADGKEYISEEYSFKTTGGNTEKSGLSFFENNVTDVTENDGRINAKISNPDGRKVTETGFYIGTSSEIFKNAMNDPCSLTNPTITVGYTMSKYYGVLQPGTTYYYKFYAIGDGQEYCSEVYSFETNSVSQPITEPTQQPAPELVPETIPEKAQPSVSVTQEKAGLSFYENSVTDVTESNGRINAKISNPDGRQVTETGFYIGTSPEVSKNGINDPCSFTSSTITIGYTMSKYYGTLQPGTTYYYKFYAMGDGQEYCSEIYSFRTNDIPQPEPIPTSDRQQTPEVEIQEKPELVDSDKGKIVETPSKESKISFSVEKVENITYENAKIRAEVKNPNKEKITETGFYYGSDKANMMKSIESDKGNWQTGITVSYDIGKYARVCLMPETKYYYQFYVIVDGQEVVSEVNTFTTAKESKKENEIQFDIKLVTEITSDNARIRAKVSNPNASIITETGFYIGTKNNNLIKSDKSDKGDWAVDLDISYSMKEYLNQKLKENTAYYYRFYIIMDGKEYCSDISSFKTTEIKKEEVATGKYKEINWWNNSWDNVTDFTPNTAQTPWVVQEKSGCSIASLAMCAMIKEIEGCNISEPQKALDTVRADNKRNNPSNAVWMSGETWKKYKYDNSIMYPSNEQIYECLKNGPIICHKTFTNQDNQKNCSHFSVIVGYNGNEEKLEAEGFVVKDVTNLKGVRKRNKNLAIWATDRLPYEKEIVFDRINYYKN